MICSTPVLKYYDVVNETTIQCDASESGLGATLLQNGQPVAFASRSLSAVERRYAQKEKECLAIVFATAESVVNATKRHFARHGIAEMVTDNGPQYSSAHFAKFAREWEFQRTTSSPLHGQSNGKAESAVKIAKNLVKKAKRGNKDLQMSLLEWRNTPDSNGLSPVQKLMSRRTRTTIPITEALLKPEVIDGVHGNIKRKRQQAKAAYNKHAKPLPRTPKAPWEKGSCVAKIGPRSFLIETESGNLYRRNS